MGLQGGRASHLGTADFTQLQNWPNWQLPEGCGLLCVLTLSVAVFRTLTQREEQCLQGNHYGTSVVWCGAPRLLVRQATLLGRRVSSSRACWSIRWHAILPPPIVECDGRLGPEQPKSSLTSDFRSPVNFRRNPPPTVILANFQFLRKFTLLGN